MKDGGMPVGGFPAILGHEGLGVVRQVGSNLTDPSLRPGDTVLLSFHSCQKCETCRGKNYGGCPRMTETNFINTARKEVGGNSPFSLPDGTAVHGQFFGQSSLSKMTVATEKSVVKLDARAADLPHLAPLACGYFTGASTVLNVLKPKTTDSIAVLGMGAVGLAAVMAAKAIGLQDIIAVDIVDSKLRVAIDVGASHAINSSLFANLDEAIRSTFPNGVDKIVDTTGVIPVIQDSVKALAHEGTLALVGVPPPSKTVQVDALDLLLSCKKIIGVIEGLSNPQAVRDKHCVAPLETPVVDAHALLQTIPALMKLYHEGKFPVDKLSTVYPAENMKQAIDDFKAGRVSDLFHDTS